MMGLVDEIPPAFWIETHDHCFVCEKLLDDHDRRVGLIQGVAQPIPIPLCGQCAAKLENGELHD